MEISFFIVWETPRNPAGYRTYHIFLDGSKALDDILGWMVIAHRLCQRDTTLAYTQDKYRSIGYRRQKVESYIYLTRIRIVHISTHRDEEHHDDTL